METRLQILTAAGTVFDEPVCAVLLPLEGGEYGVLPGHAPLLGAVRDGVVRCTRADDTREYIAVGPGVAHVTREGVTLLVRTAEPAETINLPRAEAAERRARDRLSRRDAELDIVRAEASLRRALVRQQAARLGRQGK